MPKINYKKLFSEEAQIDIDGRITIEVDNAPQLSATIRNRLLPHYDVNEQVSVSCINNTLIIRFNKDIANKKQFYVESFLPCLTGKAKLPKINFSEYLDKDALITDENKITINAGKNAYILSSKLRDKLVLQPHLYDNVSITANGSNVIIEIDDKIIDKIQFYQDKLIPAITEKKKPEKTDYSKYFDDSKTINKNGKLVFSAGSEARKIANNMQHKIKRSDLKNKVSVKCNKGEVEVVFDESIENKQDFYLDEFLPFILSTKKVYGQRTDFKKYLTDNLKINEKGEIEFDAGMEAYRLASNIRKRLKLYNLSSLVSAASSSNKVTINFDNSIEDKQMFYLETMLPKFTIDSRDKSEAGADSQTTISINTISTATNSSAPKDQHLDEYNDTDHQKKPKKRKQPKSKINSNKKQKSNTNSEDSQSSDSGPDIILVRSNPTKTPILPAIKQESSNTATVNREAALPEAMEDDSINAPITYTPRFTLFEVEVKKEVDNTIDFAEAIIKIERHIKDAIKREKNKKLNCQNFTEFTITNLIKVFKGENLTFTVPTKTNGAFEYCVRNVVIKTEDGKKRGKQKRPYNSELIPSNEGINSMIPPQTDTLITITNEGAPHEATRVDLEAGRVKEILVKEAVLNETLKREAKYKNAIIIGHIALNRKAIIEEDTSHILAFCATESAVVYFDGDAYNKGLIKTPVVDDLKKLFHFKTQIIEAGRKSNKNDFFDDCFYLIYVEINANKLKNHKSLSQ